MYKHEMYRAILSTDWSECLSPSGPFDFISYIYPDLEPDLETVFKQYTSNQISLGDASKRIEGLLPSVVTEDQMDAYLDDSFAIYKGAPDLIEWCLSHNILFMINTTAMVGYFQRVFAKGLIPQIPVLSANPLMQYTSLESDPKTIYPLYEIQDKGKNSEAATQTFNIPSEKVMLMGDSGGDGAHFEWGAKQGAFLIGSMTKASLSSFCDKKDIMINHRFGHSYSQGEGRDIGKEMEFNFMGLTSIIKEILEK